MPRRRRKRCRKRATQPPRQRGRRARHKTNGDEKAATGNRHGTDDRQTERGGAAGAPTRQRPRGTRHHDHARTARPRRPHHATGQQPGSEDEQGRHYAATPQRAANTDASQREARPRPTGTGGGATGTDTHQPEPTGARRTAQNPAPQRGPHERENRDAAANDENRATATNPDHASRDGRNDTPRAEPAQGASAKRAERTTDDGKGARREATGHPQRDQAQPERPGHTPRQRAPPTRDRPAQGFKRKRTLVAGRAGAAHQKPHSPKNISKPANPSVKALGGVGKATARGGTRRPLGRPRAAYSRGVAPWRAKAARRIGPLGNAPRPTGRAESPGTGKDSGAFADAVGLDGGILPHDAGDGPTQRRRRGGANKRRARGATTTPTKPGALAARRECRAARPDAAAPDSAPPRGGPRQRPTARRPLQSFRSPTKKPGRRRGSRVAAG